MDPIRSQNQLHEEIQKIFAMIASNAVVMHTDLFRMRFVQRKIPLQQQLKDLFQILVKASDGKTLLFPTFNYDFCRTHSYNPSSDPCQVGTFNEYVRQLYPDARTLTPVFNFCVYNNYNFSLKPVENPFSEASTFGELTKNNAAILFLGASFSANTFIHYVEECFKIGYRYIKLFPGIIHNNETEQKILLQYRVRPMIDNAVVYDWDRLLIDLVNSEILHQIPFGSSNLLWFNSRQLLNNWLEHLKNDELYFLTDSSRRKIEELYAKYGRPLCFENLEKT